MLKSVGFDHTSQVEIDDALCVFACPGGVRKQDRRHERAYLWPLGKTAFWPKSDEKVLVFVGFSVLLLSGAVGGGI